MVDNPVQVEIPMPDQPTRDDMNIKLASAVGFLCRKGYRVLPAGRRDHVVIGRARWLVDDDKLMMMARAEGWRD